MSTIGIDTISFYVPALKVSMKNLAERRNIPFEKLHKGLGLTEMAIPDLNEDAASFAANALLRLFKDHNINPLEVGRIYMGTESAIDGSKPTATYAVEIVEKELSKTFGERCFKNCDVVDMTFACIGAVDALQNSLDWVKNDPKRKAIVIASDLSKYELLSTGEYTQGAGAVALLISHNPSILTIEDTWGVAMKSEGDFFKPRRSYSKSAIVKELISQLNIPYSDADLEHILKNSSSEFWNDPNSEIEIFKEEPVFDGQFSNECYEQRMTEAFDHFNTQKPTNFINDWQHFIFHLPYAFHGRRIIFNNWLNWVQGSAIYDELIDEIGNYSESDKKDWLKRASKSNTYKQFVNAKIASGEKASSLIGNMYTASIFMSLLSLLNDAYNNDVELTDQNVGFIAYGSGSKSKVFKGTVQSTWKDAISKVNLFETLSNRIDVDIDTYEQLHMNKVSTVIHANNHVKMSYIESGETNRGLRRYTLS